MRYPVRPIFRSVVADGGWTDFVADVVLGDLALVRLVDHQGQGQADGPPQAAPGRHDVELPGQLVAHVLQQGAEE